MIFIMFTCGLLRIVKILDWDEGLENFKNFKKVLHEFYLKH